MFLALQVLLGCAALKSVLFSQDDMTASARMPAAIAAHGDTRQAYAFCDQSIDRR